MNRKKAKYLSKEFTGMKTLLFKVFSQEKKTLDKILVIANENGINAYKSSVIRASLEAFLLGLNGRQRRKFLKILEEVR